MINDDWDPAFASVDVNLARTTGGFYRALAAETKDQHRSAVGPTFRARCGDSLVARMLVGIPAAPEPYRAVLAAFIDYLQVEVTVDGGSATAVHRLTLTSGVEHTLTIGTPPLTSGIHRLVIVLFDDDSRPGFFGWHDVVGDIYVGERPASLLVPSIQQRPSRYEPAVADAQYGVSLTTVPDRLRLAGTVSWSKELTLYASVYGDAHNDSRPVALVVLQDYRQLVDAELPTFVLARAQTVTPIAFHLRTPTQAVEPVRALIMTDPDREIARDGKYDRVGTFLTLASQKVRLEN